MRKNDSCSHIFSQFVRKNERMVAITLIMEVKCPVFLFAVCCEERGIQTQDHGLRHLDAVDPFSEYPADLLELL